VPDAGWRERVLATRAGRVAALAVTVTGHAPEGGPIEGPLTAVVLVDDRLRLRRVEFVDGEDEARARLRILGDAVEELDADDASPACELVDARASGVLAAREASGAHRLAVRDRTGRFSVIERFTELGALLARADELDVAADVPPEWARQRRWAIRFATLFNLGDAQRLVDELHAP